MSSLITAGAAEMASGRTTFSELWRARFLCSTRNIWQLGSWGGCILYRPDSRFSRLGTSEYTFVLHKVWKHAFPLDFSGYSIELEEFVTQGYTPVA
jgi:hypothetical protein